MNTLRKIEIKDLTEVAELYKHTAFSTCKDFLSKQELQKITDVWFSLENLTFEAKENYFVGIQKPTKNWVAAIQAELKNKSTIHIIRLYVDPAHQNQGLGAKLLKRAVSHFPSGTKIYLEVLKRNEKAKNFYITQGFTVTSEKIDTIAGIKIEKLIMTKEVQKLSSPELQN